MAAKDSKRDERLEDDIQNGHIGPDPDDPRLKIPEVLRKPVEQPKDPDEGTGVSEGVEMGRAWAVATEFVFTTLAGAILGWLFDKWRGTNPTGTMIGLGLGFVLSFYRIVRSTQKQDAVDQERKNRNRRP
jgi:F0F1-type ATP synthase assembly protein I